MRLAEHHDTALSSRSSREMTIRQQVFRGQHRDFIWPFLVKKPSRSMNTDNIKPRGKIGRIHEIVMEPRVHAAIERSCNGSSWNSNFCFEQSIDPTDLMRPPQE